MLQEIKNTAREALVLWVSVTVGALCFALVGATLLWLGVSEQSSVLIAFACAGLVLIASQRFIPGFVNAAAERSLALAATKRHRAAHGRAWPDTQTTPIKEKELQQFLAKWRRATPKEGSAAQEHFLDLCRLLGLPSPAQTDPVSTSVAFNKPVMTGRVPGSVDIWFRGRFAWEYKPPGADLNAAYLKLLEYRDALEKPPLLVVSDLIRFEIHTNFADTAHHVYAFTIEDLADPGTLRVLHAVFTNPEALRPDRAEILNAAVAPHFTAPTHDESSPAPGLISTSRAPEQTYRPRVDTGPRYPLAPAPAQAIALSPATIRSQTADMATSAGGLAFELARKWWVLLLRGILLITIGLLAFVSPLVWVTFVGIYILIDGITMLMSGFSDQPAGQSRWPLVILGVLGLIAGLLILWDPALGGITLTYVVAAWAVIGGILTVILALRLRDEIDNEWWLVFSGVLAIIFGVLVFTNVLAGILTLAGVFSVFAIVMGILSVSLAFRVRDFGTRIGAVL